MSLNVTGRTPYSAASEGLQSSVSQVEILQIVAKQT